MARRPRRYREAPELGSAVRRFSRALVRRAGEGELEAVLELRAIKRDLDVLVGQAITAAVESGGYTYSEVARECGVAVQTVHRSAERAGVKPLRAVSKSA